MSEPASSSFEACVQRTMQAIVAGVDDQDDEEEARAVLDVIVRFLAGALGKLEGRRVMLEACDRLQDDHVADEVRARLQEHLPRQ